MNGLHRSSLLLLCALLVVTAGCTSPAINDIHYDNKGISVDLTSSSEITDAWIQVIIYRITDLHQTEYLFINSPVTIKNGKNEVFLPALLEPGSYKLHIYLIQNGQRKTAVIKDIVVEPA